MADIDDINAVQSPLDLCKFSHVFGSSDDDSNDAGSGGLAYDLIDGTDHYYVSAATVALISRDASYILTSLSDPTHSTPAIYANYITYMATPQPTNIATTIVSLVMHLFFHIADGPNPCLWTAVRKEGGPGHESELYDAIHPHLLEPAELHCRERFVEKVKAWRRIGAYYAFFACQLSLGALICVRDLLHPMDIRSCARGSDDHYDVSEEADMRQPGRDASLMKYLEDEVKILEEAKMSGADEVMHALLWDVFSNFFLGFDGDGLGGTFGGGTEFSRGEKARGLFPGFEWDVEGE
ncbi:hypothetical protein PSPO01_13922 [Paraphaeosphaeria sporulosa]